MCQYTSLIIAGIIVKKCAYIGQYSVKIEGDEMKCTIFIQHAHVLPSTDCKTIQSGFLGDSRLIHPTLCNTVISLQSWPGFVQEREKDSNNTIESKTIKRPSETGLETESEYDNMNTRGPKAPKHLSLYSFTVILLLPSFSQTCNMLKNMYLCSL